MVRTDMATALDQISSARRAEYVARINRVIDYVTRHVEEPLSLDALAKVACFSPHHFHRIFGAMTGETLNGFVRRVRTERAAGMLVSYPSRSVAEIALDCGFSGSSALARQFKETFGMSASAWRAGGHAGYSKDGRATVRQQLLEMGAGACHILSSGRDPASGIPFWQVSRPSGEPVRVEVRELPSLQVAYVRHIGRYQGLAEVFQRIFQKLMRWAQARNMIGPDTQVLAVYYDDPQITHDLKLRVDACISVSPETIAEGEIGRMVVPGGSFAIGRFELGTQDYSEAWYAIVGGWLPESGYEPDDRLWYERYPAGCNDADPEGKTVVDICVPVRPL
jgi:AraC family transcriptional regulator